MSFDWTDFDWKKPLCGYDPWKNVPDGCAFFPKRAQAWCDFFEKNIRLPRGDGFAGKLITLMEYQRYIVGWLFGWLYKDDHRRRYDTVFVYIPKKNGKSGFTSALACGLFTADGTGDKKVYCAASTKDQAGLVFTDAADMTRHILPERELRGINDLSRKKVIYKPTNSLLTAISCDAGSTEGVEPSAAIVDELHVMDNQGLVDVLRKGMLTRRQPLMIYLTTAAKQGDNVCNAELDIAKRVRDNTLDLPNYLPVIYEMTEQDNWKDENVWKRVNPGYGITIRPERFRQEFALAENNPRLELEFKRLNLNFQAKDNSQWLDMEDWKRCPLDMDISELDGEPCAMGIDLSSVNDLTALSLYFPRQCAVIPYFFVPEETAHSRDDYLIWKKQGYVEFAGGKYIEEDEVLQQILKLAGYWDHATKTRIKGKYDVKVIAYDPWRMGGMAAKLDEKYLLNVQPCRQGYMTMAEPTAAFEKMVLGRKLRHFNNPVLRWMAANAQAKLDPKGNTQVVKEDKSSPRKIDGLIASIMAVWAANKSENQELFEKQSESVVFL